MMLGRVELNPDAQPAPPPPPPPMIEQHPEPSMAGGVLEYAEAGPGGGAITAIPLRSESVDPNDPSTWHNSPRNAPCPCGSGKKFKHCHGRNM